MRTLTTLSALAAIAVALFVLSTAQAGLASMIGSDDYYVSYYDGLDQHRQVGGRLRRAHLVRPVQAERGMPRSGS